jgi:hypothetical protein
MSENDEPRAIAGKDAAALLLLALVVGGLLFAAFSFITFGVPLLVVAIAGLIWIYVGIMRWIDRRLINRVAHRPPNGDPQ